MNNTWSNADNHSFYDNAEVILTDWSKMGGLTNCPDLKAISAYIQKANTLLELGAGFGRVMQYLSNHYPDKQLFAIERSQQLYTKLQQLNLPNTTLYHSDIQKFNSNLKYDLILWMWSGLTDFAKDEQQNIIGHIQKFLTATGYFIIETFPHDVTPANGSIEDNQNYTLTAENKQLHGYIPSPQEMQTYADALNLNLIELIHYTTDSGRKRKLYVLQHKI